MELRKLHVKEEVIGAICDMCHKSCQKEPDREYTHEYGTLSANWGYWSNGKDLDHEESHLCEKCFDRVREFIVSQGGIVRNTSPYGFEGTGPKWPKEFKQLPGLQVSPIFAKRVIGDLELIKETEERKEKEFIEAEKASFKAMIEEGYTREQIKETYGMTDEQLNWRLE